MWRKWQVYTILHSRHHQINGDDEKGEEKRRAKNINGGDSVKKLQLIRIMGKGTSVKKLRSHKSKSNKNKNVNHMSKISTKYGECTQLKQNINHKFE